MVCPICHGLMGESLLTGQFWICSRCKVVEWDLSIDCTDVRGGGSGERFAKYEAIANEAQFPTNCRECHGVLWRSDQPLMKGEPWFCPRCEIHYTQDQVESYAEKRLRLQRWANLKVWVVLTFLIFWILAVGACSGISLIFGGIAAIGLGIVLMIVLTKLDDLMNGMP
ncbi:MAG: hypothetical protein FWD61_11605 [Phycisphaerales bacterium]|nr:hypothetical protein [Phycisphaerales bacterium]